MAGTGRRGGSIPPEASSHGEDRERKGGRVEEVMDSLQDSTPMRPWVWILVATLMAWFIVSSGANWWGRGSLAESVDDGRAEELSKVGTTSFSSQPGRLLSS
jgi:hypothetical protein